MFLSKDYREVSSRLLSTCRTNAAHLSCCALPMGITAYCSPSAALLSTAITLRLMAGLAGKQGCSWRQLVLSANAT